MVIFGLQIVLLTKTHCLEQQKQSNICVFSTKEIVKLNYMKRIAIFASGSGSNAENIFHYFQKNHQVIVDIFLTNNPNAKVLERADKLGVESFVFNRNVFYNSSLVLDELLSRNIDFIVLAGFMWLVPENILNQYTQKIVNIHPALLPAYGGKGMYGDFVHEAVSKAGENKTGITIHFVNNKYDEGDIIFQKAVDIIPGENPQSIADKVHVLEYEWYPQIIESLLK